MVTACTALRPPWRDNLFPRSDPREYAPQRMSYNFFVTKTCGTMNKLYPLNSDVDRPERQVLNEGTASPRRKRARLTIGTCQPDDVTPHYQRPGLNDEPSLSDAAAPPRSAGCLDVRNRRRAQVDDTVLARADNMRSKAKERGCSDEVSTAWDGQFIDSGNGVQRQGISVYSTPVQNRDAEFQ